MFVLFCVVCMCTLSRGGEWLVSFSLVYNSPFPSVETLPMHPPHVFTSYVRLLHSLSFPLLCPPPPLQMCLSEMHRKSNVEEVPIVISNDEESELTSTADSAAANRRAALALDSLIVRAMAHKEKFASHLVDYAEEEQDRLEHQTNEQGATKRFKSFDDAN